MLLNNTQQYATKQGEDRPDMAAFLKELLLFSPEFFPGGIGDHVGFPLLEAGTCLLLLDFLRLS